MDTDGFWSDLDLTVLPEGSSELPEFPDLGEVTDYVEAFCRQLDFGIGSTLTLEALANKSLVNMAEAAADEDFLFGSPSFAILRKLLGKSLR